MSTSSIGNRYSNNADFDHEDEPIAHPATGDRIDVYWPIDDLFYFRSIGSIDHQRRHIINYDDGARKQLGLLKKCGVRRSD